MRRFLSSGRKKRDENRRSEQIRRYGPEAFPGSRTLHFLIEIWSPEHLVHTVIELVLVVALVCAVELLSTAMQRGETPSPSPLLVSTLQDGGIGSLRWCFAFAPSGGVIRFAPRLHGVLLLTHRLTLVDQKQVTVMGPEQMDIALRSGPADDAGIAVQEGSTLTLTNLQLEGHAHARSSLLTNAGTLTLTNALVVGNDSAHSGGGIANSGLLVLTSSTISGNRSTGNGGGIANTGTLIMNTSVISGNHAAIEGGGINNLDGLLILRDSTLSDNQAGSLGGGIFTLGGTLHLTNSTLSENTARNGGGGVYNENTLGEAINSTLFHNGATLGNGGGWDHHYTRYDGTPAYLMLFCTFADNQAERGGGIWNTARGSLTPEIALANTLIADNLGREGGPDLSGPFLTQGHNLIEHMAGASLQGTPAISATDREVPVSGELHLDTHLSRNGGNTLTLALLPGSPAIDAVPLAACTLDALPTDQQHHPIDQRGVERPQGSGCDMGAYESQGQREGRAL